MSRKSSGRRAARKKAAAAGPPPRQWRRADATFIHVVTVDHKGFGYTKEFRNFFQREHGAAGFEELAVQVRGEAAFEAVEAWHAMRSAFGASDIDAIARALRERFPAITGAPPPPPDEPTPPPTTNNDASDGGESAAPVSWRARAEAFLLGLGYVLVVAMVVFGCLNGGFTIFAIGLRGMHDVWRAQVVDAWVPVDAMVVASVDRGLVDARVARGPPVRRRLAAATVRYELAGQVYEPSLSLEVPDTVNADRSMKEKLATFAPGKAVRVLVDPARPDTAVGDRDALPGFVAFLTAGLALAVGGVLLVVGAGGTGIVLFAIVAVVQGGLERAWRSGLAAGRRRMNPSGRQSIT